MIRLFEKKNPSYLFVYWRIIFAINFFKNKMISRMQVGKCSGITRNNILYNYSELMDQKVIEVSAVPIKNIKINRRTDSINAAFLTVLPKNPTLFDPRLVGL